MTTWFMLLTVPTTGSRYFKPDGTFVKEAFVARQILTPSGTAGSLAFSADSSNASYMSQVAMATSGYLTQLAASLA
jgi:hypothetical protein